MSFPKFGPTGLHQPRGPRAPALAVPKDNSPYVTKRPTIAVDFDGVIHDYHLGWNNGHIGDPMPGAIDALRRLAPRYRMVVFTARWDLRAVSDALRRWGILPLFEDVTNRKPAAEVYLDDRALHFTSWAQALGDLL